MESQKNTPGRWPSLIAAGLVILAVFAAFLFRGDYKGENAEPNRPRIGYDQGAVMLDERSDLQSAVDAMLAQAQSGGVSLSYRNNAYSTDGSRFECYIANSTANQYDFYLDIYADPELTDRLFLSGLVRPGSAFEEIRLARPLDAGDYMVYVVVTQVEEVDGEQGLHAQVSHTMNFHVITEE